jgi:hypothetical protein
MGAAPPPGPGGHVETSQLAGFNGFSFARWAVSTAVVVQRKVCIGTAKNVQLKFCVWFAEVITTVALDGENV